MENRDRVVDRLVECAVPLVAFIAPAGYGKTRAAQAFASRFPRSISVTVTTGDDAARLFERLREAGEGVVWSAEATCVTIDAAENAADDDLRTLLTTLNESRPEHGAILVSTRREPLLFRFGDVFPPHLLVVFRRSDFELTFDELHAMMPAGASVELDLLYHIYYLTRGWPVPAIALLRASAASAFRSVALHLEHPAMRELFDWVDANAVRVLPDDLRGVLVHCVACRDMMPGDFEAVFGYSETSPDRRLYRNAQRADIGFAGEIRVHPLVALTVRAHYASDLASSAYQGANEFLEQGQPVRAARAMVSIGDARRAAEILGEASFDAATELAGFPYPGLALEYYGTGFPGFKNHPLLWLNLIPCRLFVVGENDLAREGTALLQQHDDLAPRPLSAITAMVSILHAQTGDLASARRFADLLPASGVGSDELNVDRELAEMHLDLALGRYESVRSRWHALAPRLIPSPVWHGFHFSCFARAEFWLGSADAAEELLRLQLAAIRAGGCPSIASLGAQLATFFAWYRMDSRAFEARRSEFASIALCYDVPVVWPALSANYGRDLGGARARTYDLTRNLILSDAESGDAARRRAEEAIVLADGSSDVGMRVVARIAAALRGASGAREFVSEALALARTTDSAPLTSSVEAFAAGRRESIGFLQPLLEHALVPPPRVERPLPAALEFDIARGELLRAGVPVKISEGTLQLLAFLAVHERPSRTTVADALWPDLDGDAAINALKVCVHRARLQIGDAKSIVAGHSALSLGESVASTYARLDELARSNPPFTGDLVVEIDDAFDRLVRGLSSGWFHWEWFVPFRDELLDDMRALGSSLAEGALNRDDGQTALSVARKMIGVDPLGERGRSLAMRAYGKIGNWTAAIVEFREYAALLERELGSKPSPELERLISSR